MNLANYAYRLYISYICIQCGYPFLNLARCGTLANIYILILNRILLLA